MSVAPKAGRTTIMNYINGKPSRGDKSEYDSCLLMPWGASTCKGNTVFLHLLAEQPKEAFKQYEVYAPPQWKGEPLTLPALPDRRILKSYVLGKPTEAIDVKMDASKLTVTVPEKLREPIDTVVVLELDGDAVAIRPINAWKETEMEKKALPP